MACHRNPRAAASRRTPAMRNFLIALCLLISVDSVRSVPARRRASAQRPFPDCAMITGTPAVTFTRDDGRTLAPRAEALSGIGYTYGLAALDTFGTLLAWHKNDLLISRDHGCSWRLLDTITDPEFPPKIEPAKGGRAYAWSDNRKYFLRYDSSGVTKSKPPVAFVGVGVDAADGSHIRAGGDDGSLWESHDAGDTWAQIGSLRAGSPIIYRFAFDPANLDHIVAGTSGDGAYFTRDAGRNWSRATGMGAGNVNAFNFAIFPADGEVVWAMAINLMAADANVPSHGRHIYRSTDGGATYTAVIDEGSGVKLVNGPVMAAHPRDRNVLYFVFGTRTQGYGTDLFRWDASSQTVSVSHNEQYDINAIAFSPFDPRVMYLGLETEIGIR